VEIFYSAHVRQSGTNVMFVGSPSDDSELCVSECERALTLKLHWCFDLLLPSIVEQCRERIKQAPLNLVVHALIIVESTLQNT